MTTTAEALPADACALEGPCGVCATLTPAARTALADSLLEGAPVQGVMGVLDASAALLRELTALLESDQVRDLVVRARAHLDTAHGADPEWWRSPTSKDLNEVAGALEDALDVIDFRRREQQRARTALAEVLSQS